MNVRLLRGVEDAAGQGQGGGGNPVAAAGRQLGHYRFAVHGPEDEVGDQVGVEVGALGRDQRADVLVAGRILLVP